MQAPAGAGVTASALELIIHCVATRSYHLFFRRGDRPTATVNCPTFFHGLDFDGCAIHLFSGFQPGLVGVDRVLGIKTAADRLRSGTPIRIELRAFHLRPNQSNALPALNRRIINIGKAIALFAVYCRALAHFGQGVHIALGHYAFGVFLNDPSLCFVICGLHGRVCAEQPETQLAQTAPDAHLIAVMIARHILVTGDNGSVCITIFRASIWPTLEAGIAAVCRLTIEPDEPSAIHKLGGSNAARGHAGCRAGFVSTGTSTGLYLFPCFSFQPDIQDFFHSCAVRGSVTEHRRKIVIALDIDACGGCRCFHIAAIQNGSSGFFICKSPVVIQQLYIIGEDDLRGTMVSGILHLNEDGNSGKALTGPPGNCDGQSIRIQGFSVHIPAVFGCLPIVPLANADFGITGSDGQAATANVTAGWRIRQIIVEHFCDLAQIGR